MVNDRQHYIQIHGPKLAGSATTTKSWGLSIPWFSGWLRIHKRLSTKHQEPKQGPKEGTHELTLVSSAVLHWHREEPTESMEPQIRCKSGYCTSARGIDKTCNFLQRGWFAAPIFNIHVCAPDGAVSLFWCRFFSQCHATHSGKCWKQMDTRHLAKFAFRTSSNNGTWVKCNEQRVIDDECLDRS